MTVDLFGQRPVLDVGYVQLVEMWGTDARIIEAARMSTGKGFQGFGPRCQRCGLTAEQITPGFLLEEIECTGASGAHSLVDGDEKLLRYLWEHRHATPFEMAGFVLEIKAPIFVFREWHRHRTQSYNEMSARYTPLPDENYVPTVERLLVGAHGNRQAASTGAQLDTDGAHAAREKILAAYAEAEHTYRNLLTMGAPKELARLVVPVGRYSRMRASANLRNWLAFLTLRMDAAAQWEIRQYANTVGEIVAELFPRTWELFRGGAT